MIVNKRELKQALNRVYLKIKPDTETIQVFKANLTRLLEQCDSKKSEEFNKNLLIDFLKNTYYTDRYFINTKERIDLVIHNNQDVKSPVGVIFETKKPTRTINAEMPRLDNLNTKAFQQLVLYFLRERVTDKNLEIKHLIVTNVYEWFIFDGKIFEELFFANKALVNQFGDFEAGRLSSTKTDFFYQQIAEPAIALGNSALWWRSMLDDVRMCITPVGRFMFGVDAKIRVLMLYYGPKKWKNAGQVSC